MTRKEIDLIEALFNLYLQQNAVGGLSPARMATGLRPHVPPWLKQTWLLDHFRQNEATAERSLQRTYGALWHACTVLDLGKGEPAHASYLILFSTSVFGKSGLLLQRTRGPYETYWAAIPREEQTRELSPRWFGEVWLENPGWIPAPHLDAWVDPLREGVHRLKHAQRLHMLAYALAKGSDGGTDGSVP